LFHITKVEDNFTTGRKRQGTNQLELRNNLLKYEM